MLYKVVFGCHFLISRKKGLGLTLSFFTDRRKYNVINVLFLRIAGAPQLSRYEINQRSRGYCVIINNFNFQNKNMADRTGSREDEKSLKNLFEDLNFNVIIKRDLSKHEIKSVAEKYGRIDHSSFGAFVFVLMSHGGDRDCILGLDGKETTVKNLMVEFQAGKCPSLMGKPKVFIIQTCRGLHDNISETFVSSAGSINSMSAQADNQSFDRPFSPNSTLPKSVFPPEADFLLTFATVPGYVAFRPPESGTFFIQVQKNALSFGLIPDPLLTSKRNHILYRERVLYAARYSIQCWPEVFGYTVLRCFRFGVQ